MHVIGYCNAARFGQRFDPCGYVDAVSEYIVALDNDIAEMNTDTKPYGVGICDIGIAFDHALLNFERTFDRSNHGRKFQKQSVAHGLDDTPAVFGDQGFEQFQTVDAKCRQRTGLVRTHEARITNYISQYNRSQSALSAVRHGRRLTGVDIGIYV